MAAFRSYDVDDYDDDDKFKRHRFEQLNDPNRSADDDEDDVRGRFGQRFDHLFSNLPTPVKERALAEEALKIE